MEICFQFKCTDLIKGSQAKAGREIRITERMQDDSIKHELLLPMGTTRLLDKPVLCEAPEPDKALVAL